ncbi:chain length determinant protein [Streptacidiphilus anmyonensis]|uniref:chain length determinant protein n=1 Tax=Streptacidiphilus anmyonensis TaxID=405782 RepID=UPI000B33A086|nr:chain length determinant protein [Streptacidiphilus anmyonensis]
MDLAEIARVMRRRWYVLLPGLLLTGVLAAAIIFMLPLKYQSQSTVELLNSQKATVPFDGNPFLSTQTSLTGMADSLGRNLDSDAAKADLAGRGVTDTYDAMIADNAQAPLMWLTVTGTEPDKVLAEDKTLTAYAAERLDQFQTQQSVPQNAMIRMVTIVSPQTPVAQTKTRIEYTVLAALLGLALSLVATFFVEARRRPRPAADADAGPGTDAGRDGDTGRDTDSSREAVAVAVGPSAGRPSAPPTVAPTATPTAEPLRAGTETVRVPARPEPATAQQQAAREPEPESPTVQLAVLPTPGAAPAEQRSSWFG